MHRYSQIIKGLAALSAGMVLLPGPAARAQERTIVSNQVEVSNREASLHLEFSDGEGLTVTFADGVATVDGAVLGSYEAGGAADRAWRGLLARVLSLANGPLARELERWRPDPGLGAADLELLDGLDAVLGGAVSGAVDGGRQSLERARAGERLGALLEVMARSENIQGLGEALNDVDLESLDIVLRQDHTVSEGTSAEGGILVVGGHLDVRGRVRGDVIVLDGTLTLAEDSRIDGDVRLIQSDLDHRGGEIEGEVVDVVSELRREETEVRDRIREEVRREIGQRAEDYSRRRGRGSFSRAGRAVGGVLDAALTFLVLGVLTLLLTRFAGDRVGHVMRAVEHNPARSAAVGFAGGFLVAPVYILGIVVLAISVVGIPGLLAWVPLFPLAVALGAFMGYVGVSHHVGRWVLDQGFSWLSWVDRNHPTHVRLVGVAALLAPFAVGSALGILPVVGWIGSVFKVAGTVAGVAATVTGLGAVIITRGGKRSTTWPYAFDEEPEDTAHWSSARDMGDLEAEEDSAPGGDQPGGDPGVDRGGEDTR